MGCVIRVEHLSKSYQIGSRRANYSTLREEISQWGKQLKSRWAGREADSQAEARAATTLKALDDVNFEVDAGEIVGIVGRNGAGKSTLLKILSRITGPTSGRVLVAGRMASLLEVGTGFHPELTGRENIFLYGAILGMSRAEIRRKFDAIVAFSEIEKFIDTPVKRYSSGMYVRLAFAVAAHLEPDILIVDEVLAVGDQGFQKKCLGELKNIGKGNRTVLFVTHNLQVVRSLCTRALLVSGGKLTLDGSPEEVLNSFLKTLQGPRDLSQESVSDRKRRTSGAARYSGFAMVDAAGEERWTFESGETVRLRLRFQAQEAVPSLGFYLAVSSPLSNETVTTLKEPLYAGPLSQGHIGEFEIELPKLALRPGDYSFYILLGDAQCERIYDVIDANVNLPMLTITSSERDVMKNRGVVSLPFAVTMK